MTKRESRVINAFINCVEHGEYSVDYAVLLIEDNLRYGWLSEAAKDVFYEWVDQGPDQVSVISDQGSEQEAGAG